MPIYTYKCVDHGSFEDIRSISDRLNSECPICNVKCELEITFKEFLAKTKYTPPPLAKRHFGESRRRPPTRKKWV